MIHCLEDDQQMFERKLFFMQNVILSHKQEAQQLYLEWMGYIYLPNFVILARG